MCATMGYAMLPVVQQLRIGIISTGDELKSPGEELAYGEIYESNSYGLAGLVNMLGHIPIRYPAVHDSMDALRNQFNQTANECDLFLTSGGVSMGEWDFVRKLMEEEGEPVFWRVKIRPGSPPLFGHWNGTPMFGLPGNPVSSHVVFRMLVIPYLRGSLETPYPHDQIVPEVSQPKHAGFGIGSFVISILNGALIVILTITAGVMDENGVTEDDPEMQVVGILILGSILLAMIGSGLGVFSCFQKDKKKILGIIGLVLNALTVLGGIILMMI